jgi:hypothetical protein
MKQLSIILSAAFIWAGCAAPNPRPALAENGPAAVSNEMKTRLAARDISGTVACFSAASKDDHQQTLSSMSTTELHFFLKAQYYYENVTGGKTITFPIEFDKENGEWKIVEF